MTARPLDFKHFSEDGLDQFRRILEYAFAKNGGRKRLPVASTGRTPLTDSGAAHEGQMKAMASTPDYYVPPAVGPHEATIIAAEPGLSTKGNSQIKISVQLDASGEALIDYLGTDGTVKGAGLSKAKLRALGINVDSDAEVPDEQIAAQLLGRKTIVELEHENQEKKDEASNTWVPATHFDSVTGQTIQLKRARVKGFRAANVGGMVPAAPAPQQYQAQQAQQAYAQAPQGFPQQAAQPPFAQQAAPAPQYAPPAQQQYAPPQQAYAPPVQQAQQYAPPAQQQYAQPAPVPQAWAPPAGAPQPQYAQAPQQAQQYAPPQQQYAAPPQIPQPAPAMAPVQMQPPAPPGQVPWATAPQAPTESPAQQEEKKRRGRPPKAPADGGGQPPQQ